METAAQILDQMQVIYLRHTLSKLRVHRGLSRTEVATRMGVDKSRVDAFEDGKVPWESVAISFVQQYTHAVGANFLVVVNNRER